MRIDDAIAAAGEQLAAAWKNETGMQPDNDLHPDPAATAFRVKLLENRVSELERIVQAMRGTDDGKFCR